MNSRASSTSAALTRRTTRTIRAALAAATQRLARTSETPRLDAELLMAHALGIGREALLVDRLEQEAPAGFEALVARRAASEPVPYIIGRRAFWTIDLEVGPGVLIPRPETETLIEAACDHFGSAGPRTVLDLGTGSGALLLAALAEWPHAMGLGIDRSQRAIEIARANADRLGLADRAHFQRGDWADGIGGRFDLVLCNPPYVEEEAQLPRDVYDWEPREALLAGADGLAELRRLAPAIGPLLAEGGIACIEIGAGQAAAASALLQAEGRRVRARADLAGHLRCLVLGH